MGELALLLGALTAMGPLAIDVYLPALPAIARDMGVPMPAVQASLAAYFAGIAIGQALYGPLSDQAGRRPALLAGLVLFTVASIGCASTSAPAALIGWRFLQALGGCAPLVVPRAVVRDYFDQQGSARMLSSLMLVMGAAPILGPLVGGQLLLRAGWRSIFWALAGYGALLTALVWWRLGESLARERRRTQHPAAVLRAYGALLRDRAFLTYTLTGAGIFAGLLSYISASPHVFIEIFGVAPERYGFYFGTNAVGIIGASQINRWLVGRYDARRVLRVVLPCAAIAGAGILVASLRGAGFSALLVPLFCFVASHGIVLPNTTALAMARHGAVAGSASALMGTLQFAVATGASALVSAWAGPTPVPLGVVMAGCGVLALSAFALAPASDARTAHH